MRVSPKEQLAIRNSENVSGILMMSDIQIYSWQYLEIFLKDKCSVACKE
jgi:hypothetical protein